MKSGKSPGWDGLPPEMYLTFWDILGTPLLDMINTVIDKGTFNPNTNAAIITLLLKPNKDPTFCSNHRPLSLLNGDVKLFAKVLAPHLNKHLSSLIHYDKTGFIKGRLASDKVRRLLHLIHAAKAIDSPCSVLSLDAEKTFDRHSIISKFIWNGKKPCLKLRTLQQDKTTSGLAVPNFKAYFMSFVLRPLSAWFSSIATVSWKSVEENISQPFRLQDLVFLGIPLKEAGLHLGPIISYSLKACRTVLTHSRVDLKWHKHAPIFNNFSIIGNKPITFSQWREIVVNVLMDLYNDEGLRTFNDLRAE